MRYLNITIFAVLAISVSFVTGGSLLGGQDSLPKHFPFKQFEASKAAEQIKSIKLAVEPLKSSRDKVVAGPTQAPKNKQLVEPSKPGKENPSIEPLKLSTAITVTEPLKPAEPLKSSEVQTEAIEPTTTVASVKLVETLQEPIESSTEPLKSTETQAEPEAENRLLNPLQSMYQGLFKRSERDDDASQQASAEAISIARRASIRKFEGFCEISSKPF